MIKPEIAQSALGQGRPIPTPTQKLPKAEALAARHRLPEIDETPPFVTEGELLSHSVSQYAQISEAAVYVDKIYKGAKAGNPPVGQAATLEMVVNMKHARELGSKMPEPIMLRVTRVIDRPDRRKS